MACPIPYGGHKYCCVAKRCKVDSRKQHLPSMLAPLYSEESRTHTEKWWVSRDWTLCLYSALRQTCFAQFLANVNSRSRSLYMLSPVCLSSVTFVRPTQAVQIFGNISTALGNLAIRGHPLKILRRSSQRNPSAGGVKDKRGSQI